MKFRLLDLFVVTAVAAAIVAAFRVDPMFGIQLAGLVAILLGAAWWSLRRSNRRIRFVPGAIGGLAGAALVAAALLPLRDQLPDSVGGSLNSPIGGFIPTPLVTWTIHTASLLWAGWMLGAVLGPMGALQWERRAGQPESMIAEASYRRQLQISWLLLAGIPFICFLEMLDRINMAPRDWFPVRILIAAIFLGYTYQWLARVKKPAPTADHCDSSRQPTG